MATRAPDNVAAARDSHAIQAALAAALARDVARLWPALDKKRLSETFPDWLRMMSQLVERYHGMSSQAASIFYSDVRQAHTGVPTPATVLKFAPAPAQEWIDKAFGYSGPGLLQDGSYQDSTALSTTQGTAVRIAATGGRDTVLGTVANDPKAVGWYRVTDGAPCAFCALLASRVAMKTADGMLRKGSLYRTEESASFKAHNDCGCTAAPYFSRHQILPDVNRRAAEVYQNRGKGPALGAFRKAWAEHLAGEGATGEPHAA